MFNVVNTCRCKRLTGHIKRSFSYIIKTVFLQLYKILIRSILHYGIVVWFPASKKNIQLIENIEKRATKIDPELKCLLYRRQRYGMIQL